MVFRDFMTYAVQVEGGGENGFVARLKGIPGAIKGADTRGEAIAMAQALVCDWALGCFESGEHMPAGDPACSGEAVVSVGADANAKIMVRNEMIRRGVSIKEAAARMGNASEKFKRGLRLSTPASFSLLHGLVGRHRRRLGVSVK